MEGVSQESSSPSVPLPNISHLRAPLETGSHLTPNFLQDTSQLAQLYPTIKDISYDPKRKDRPFAEDEFLEEAHFLEYAESGFALEFRNSESGDVDAYGFITPSIFQRIERPFYADLRVCTLEGSPSVKVLLGILSCLVDIAKTIGYRACTLDTFVCNVNHIEAVRCLEFQNVLIIPMSGRVPRYGLMETLQFFKSLYPMDQPFPKPDDPSMQHLPEYRLEKPLARHPNLTGFPVKTALDDGTPVVITYTEKRHIPIIQGFYREAVSRGLGFGAFEEPPVEVFEAVVAGEDPGHGFAVEVEGRTIGVMYISPNMSCRSHDPSVTDAAVIVDLTYQSKGTGTLFAKIWLRLSTELGYKGVFSDTYVRNQTVINIMRNHRISMRGSMWRGVYLEGAGFLDTITFFKENTPNDPYHCKWSKL